MTREAVTWIVVFVLALAVQGSLVPTIAIAGVTPDMPMIALFFFAVRTGSLPGIIVGFVLGLCQDLYAPSILGRNALAATLCGWFAGLFNDRVMRTDPLLKGVILIAAFFLHDAVLAAISIARSGGSFSTMFGDMFLWTLPRALYSLAFVGLFIIWDMYFKPSLRR
jgi:rod shape-determining protein MreD